jgi:cytidylate kinase
MAVITVSRQIGSLGTEIARESARGLGYDYVDKEKMEKLLAASGFPEPQIQKFDEKKPPFWDSLSLERRKFLHSAQAIIYELAHKGRVVIVGRGGQVLLKDVPGILHVRVISPFEARVKRMTETGGFEEKQAGRFLRQGDQESFGFIHTFFHVNWDDPCLYDLIINTAKISVGTAIQWITAAVQSPDMAGREEEARVKLADLALVQRAEALLMDVVGNDIRLVEIEAKKGVVTLKGSIASARGRENCEKAVAALGGVLKVENYLTVAQFYRLGP